MSPLMPYTLLESSSKRATAVRKISYTVTEAAEATGLSKKVLWRLIQTGDLRAIRPRTAKIERGQRIEMKGDMLIMADDLMSYLKEHSEEVA